LSKMMDGKQCVVERWQTDRPPCWVGIMMHLTELIASDIDFRTCSLSRDISEEPHHVMLLVVAPGGST
jgi:hypothetical protein